VNRRRVVMNSFSIRGYEKIKYNGTVGREGFSNNKNKK